MLEYNDLEILPSDFLKSLQCTIIIFSGTYINSWQWLTRTQSHNLWVRKDLQRQKKYLVTSQHQCCYLTIIGIGIPLKSLKNPQFFLRMAWDLHWKLGEEFRTSYRKRPVCFCMSGERVRNTSPLLVRSGWAWNNHPALAVRVALSGVGQIE